MTIPDRLAAALADRYRVERELGSGGMATVHLAADLKHDRQVAIKVLRPELAAVVGGDRFISEIRTTANLQHPHILPLFDSGESENFLWYAMPFVQGETLQEKLAREKQLPIPEAIAIAVKVAGALQAAHDAGIIHRDIKPANILLANGEPLVADFGIALAVQEAGGGRLTETGLSVGTPYYMSPEQATADRDPDARSDLYSLACLVYEMIAGDPPFTGGTAQAVLGQILTQAPPRVTVARSTTPPNVEAALLQALQKLPADRFETVAEFAKALQTEGYVGPAARATGAYATVGGGRSAVVRWAPWAIAAAAVVLAAATLLSGDDGPPDGARPAPVRFTLEDRSDWFGGGRNLAISADGSVLAYQDLVDGRPVWVRRDFRQVGAEPVPRSEGALYAAVSPRGRWIAWDSGPDSVLYRIQPGATVPVVMAHPQNPPMGISWRDESTIVGGMLWFDGDYPFVQSASIDDSTLVQVSDPAVDGGFGMHHEPYALPGGTHALIIDFQDDVGFSVLDLEDGSTRAVDLGGATPRSWAAITGVSDDVLLFREQGPRLMAIGWDPDRLETMGRARAVPGIDGFVEDAALAHDGTLALLFAPSAFRPVLVDDRGQVLRDLGIDDVGRHMFPRVSPGGELVYLEGGLSGQHRDWMVDLRSNTVRDFPVAADRRSAFGERIGDWVDGETFVAPLEIGLVAGPDPVQLIARSSRPEAVGERALLPDTLTEWEHLEVSPTGGHAMVTRQRDEGNQREVGVLDMGSGEVTPFAGLGTGSTFAPRISPDGTRVAFVVDAAGLPEVYVTSFPTQGVVTRVSSGRAGQPVWDPSGDRLYYVSPSGLTAVDLAFEPGDGLASVVAREVLFDVPMFGDASSEVATYDVHPEGFVLALEQGDDTGRIEVWKNWIHELRPVLGRPGQDPR